MDAKSVPSKNNFYRMWGSFTLRADGKRKIPWYVGTIFEWVKFGFLNSISDNTDIFGSAAIFSHSAIKPFT